jgi:hypothetical protein
METSVYPHPAAASAHLVHSKFKVPVWSRLWFWRSRADRLIDMSHRHILAHLASCSRSE